MVFLAFCFSFLSSDLSSCIISSKKCTLHASADTLNVLYKRNQVSSTLEHSWTICGARVSCHSWRVRWLSP
ncbi:MAG: hypothetical protein BYD32DRAFT_272005 [Podila humilis]|nr:MAG: hypothetical protein BYD32DRAFT_272005 [Podila humilis]